jgi:hypothetical protein
MHDFICCFPVLFLAPSLHQKKQLQLDKTIKNAKAGTQSSANVSIPFIHLLLMLWQNPSSFFIDKIPLPLLYDEVVSYHPI